MNDFVLFVMTTFGCVLPIIIAVWMLPEDKTEEHNHEDA